MPYEPIFEDITQIMRPADAVNPVSPVDETTVSVPLYRDGNQLRNRDGDHLRVRASNTYAGDPTLTFALQGWPGSTRAVADPRICAPALRELGELLVKVADRYEPPPECHNFVLERAAEEPGFLTEAQEEEIRAANHRLSVAFAKEQRLRGARDEMEELLPQAEAEITEAGQALRELERPHLERIRAVRANGEAGI